MCFAGFPERMPDDPGPGSHRADHARDGAPPPPKVESEAAWCLGRYNVDLAVPAAPAADKPFD